MKIVSQLGLRGPFSTMNDEQWTMNKKDNTLFIVYRLMVIVPK